MMIAMSLSDVREICLDMLRADSDIFLWKKYYRQVFISIDFLVLWRKN